MVKFHHEKAQVVIINHATITIKKENTIIADIKIFINHCTKTGNAVALVTLVVSHLLESVFISIQSQINGTTVFNCIQQHFLDESQIHFVCASFGFVHVSHSAQSLDQLHHSGKYWLSHGHIDDASSQHPPAHNTNHQVHHSVGWGGFEHWFSTQQVPDKI